MRTPCIAITIALVLTGCAANYQEPALSANHPASPDAAAAPHLEHSSTLALSNDAPAAAAGVGDHAMHGGAREAASSLPDTMNPSAANLYVCPMHPLVTSGKPDQRCPECGMKLVKRSEGGDAP
jgi:hypothetical protein